MSIDPLENPQPLIERVYSYVAYRVGDGVHAEDITSETFERALRYRKRYDERRGSPISWLIGIARRVIADHVAGQHAHAAEVPELAADGAFEEQGASPLEPGAAGGQPPERGPGVIAARLRAGPSAEEGRRGPGGR